MASVCGPCATANDEKLDGDDAEADAAGGDGDCDCDDDRNVDRVGPSPESSGCPVEAAAAASPARRQRKGVSRRHGSKENDEGH